ncbi:MAG: patatin-like phospholipase family protein [Myxococcota bacterium]
MSASAPRTAFVLAGGGSLGAVEVGMLEALVEFGLRPDLIVGSSAGALNGAFFAGRPDAAGVRALREIWQSLRARDVFPFSPLGSLLGVLAVRDHIVDPGPLRRLLEKHLRFREIEAAQLPLHVVATDLLTGGQVVLSHGPVVPAVLASAAIPGVFPPVRIGHAHLFDGGIASNTPIAAAIELGAERVIVLPTGYSCEMKRPPPSALAMALHGVNLIIARQLVIDIERFTDRTQIRVIPPLCPLAIQPFDFSYAATLIERAAATTRDWLARGGLERPDIPHELPVHAHDVI